MASTLDSTDATDATDRDVTTIAYGTCHHDCPDSCGWIATVENGVAVKLRGDPDHPFSKGELCPKVNHFIERTYSDRRITTPLRRVGPKGSGEFETISWATALEEISAQLHAVVETHGAEAVLPFSGAGNQSLLAMGFPYRLWNALGVTRLQGALCGAVAGAGVAMTNGTKLALDPEELAHSKLIIIWGSNTRLTNRHLWPTIEAARTNGARIIVIDPIRTITADEADQFIQPLPGTDVALMLAMMHVIIRDGLQDHEWVAAHTLGFAELEEHVREWTPQRAAEICGLAEDEIATLAREYATIRPAAIRTLIGAEHREHGGMFFRTLACLPALVGAWRDRGGGLARSVGSWTDLVIDLDALSRPDLLGTREPRVLDEVRLADILTNSELSPSVHALFIWGTNPMVSVPNTELLRKGFERSDLFTVVHEQFLTDTARYADIVLPATTQLESVDVTPAWGHLNLGWNEAAIAPVGESISNAEFHRQLARALGLTEPALFEDDLTVLTSSLPSIDIDQLRDQHRVRVPYPEDGRPFGDGVFPTASGRVEFVSEALRSMGQPALPTYEAPNEYAPVQLERFPFRLLTPKQHARFLNSSYSHLPKHQRAEHQRPEHGSAAGGPYVEMVAADATALNLSDGALVKVSNDRGEVTLRVRVTERLRTGVVAIPWGWWGDAHEGGVANSLTSDRLTDWGGGVAYSDTLVAVTAAKGG
ncbi:MAG: molybdopterin-dependent oxidoreductase [Actinomycetes bacterium]